jgi:hypothetical protein
MSTISHPPVPERQGVLTLLRIREMWAALSIFAMWLAVAVASVWGPDFVGNSNDGNSTTIPSGIAIALFATIGSWVVAKYGFGHSRKEE